jgi:hypothetical protein
VRRERRQGATAQRSASTHPPWPHTPLLCLADGSRAGGESENEPQLVVEWLSFFFLPRPVPDQIWGCAQGPGLCMGPGAVHRTCAQDLELCMGSKVVHGVRLCEGSRVCTRAGAGRGEPKVTVP